MTDGSPAARTDAAGDADATVDSLWLAAQHAAAAGAAHEIKNALNGVSVNLAVVQSRLRRQQAPESVTRFADAALSQLELLTNQVEALLALVRPPGGAVDVVGFVRQLIMLAGRGSSGDAPFALVTPDAAAAQTRLDAASVRTLVATALSPALAQPGPGACEVSAQPDGSLRLLVRAGEPFGIGPAARHLAAAAGVALTQPAAAELVLTFPPARDAASP